MTSEDIVVVGAGPAGLAVSACLRRHGLAHLLLERHAEVAPAWRRHYDRLHLHTSKRHSGLPGMPWPAAAPRYPSRAEVVDYLAAYAATQAAPPRFGITVRRIERRGERFAVDTSAGPLAPRHVVVASGGNELPLRPSFPGLDGFAGSVVHARDYRNPAPYAGKRTLVVGCGNSGAEIALDLAEHGVDVAMVVRGPVHVVPRDLLGLPAQEAGLLLSHLPRALADGIADTVTRFGVGDLSRWGLVRPALGLGRMIEDFGRAPLLDVGTVAMIKAGRIRVLPGIEQVSAHQLRFADGTQHPFDAIVLATGYAPGLERLVGGFEAIADGRGRPDRFGRESSIPGLYFVGFRYPIGGALREIGIEAQRVADALRERA